ncbi:hypothetical protein JR334_05515 [Clostridia bacterium]|nr:hypothetical protein JR334_05515 [Clostridia bacterium]
MKRMRFLFGTIVVLGLFVLPCRAFGADAPVITKPNGGEFLGRGSEATVEWTDNNTTTFEFYLSTDSGASYDIFLGEGSGNSFTFTVPQISSNTARIKMTGLVAIRDLGMGIKLPVYGSDESDADFSMGYTVIPIDPIIMVAYPAMPTNLKVGTDSSMFTHDITWDDNAANESGFKIFRRHEDSFVFTEIASVGANVTAYKDTDSLVVGDKYYYKVYAYNGFGNSSYSNTYEYEVLGLVAIPLYPFAPSELDLGADGDMETHDLTWKDNSSNETGFKIYRKVGTSLIWTQIDTVGADITSYEDEDTLMIGETYHYQVSAYNGFGNSEYSNSVAYMVVDPDATEPVLPSSVVIDLVIGQKNYQVNGLDKNMDVAPVIMDGRTLLPVRYIADPLGAAVGWNNGTQKATVRLGSTYLELWIDNPTARVDGIERLIDSYNDEVTPVIVPPGRTMLPLRFIAEALGCEVNYDGPSQSIEVIYPAP